MFTPRSGQIEIISTVPKRQINKHHVQRLCIKEVLRLKPTYKIFCLDITEIKLVK